MPSPVPAHPPLRVAVLGCGVVGTQVARLLTSRPTTSPPASARRSSSSASPCATCLVQRDGVVDRAAPDADAEALVARADVVVEVMGGIEPRARYSCAAIAAASPSSPPTRRCSPQHGPSCSPPPTRPAWTCTSRRPSRAPSRSSPGARVARGRHSEPLRGIVNGTTNYVLDQMTRRASTSTRRVKEAQELGYAEADPTADVEGFDAAAKAAILASLAFHPRVSLDDVYREGITRSRPPTCCGPLRTGHVIKLLAIAERADGAEGVQVRVHPALVPADHPLAGVRGAFNAIFVEAEAAGELMFYGRGAGGAHRVGRLGRRRLRCPAPRVGGRGPGNPTTPNCRCCPPTRATRYQVRIDVADRPASSRRSPRCSPRTACPSRPCASRPRPTDALRAPRHHHARRPRARPRGTVEAIARPRRRPSVVSVLRVEGV